MNKAVKKQKGFILIVTMMISMIVMIIGYALIDTSILETKSITNIKEYKAMMADVEFGLEYAKQQMLTNSSSMPGTLYGKVQYIIDKNSNPTLPTPSDVIGPYEVRLVITITNVGNGVSMTSKEKVGFSAEFAGRKQPTSANKIYRIKSVLQEKVNGQWKSRHVAEEYVVNEVGG